MQRIPQHLGNKAHPGGCTSLWTIAIDLQQALHWELKLEFNIHPIQYKYIKMKAHVIPRVHHRLNSAALLFTEAASRVHRDILPKIPISKREAADFLFQLSIQNHMTATGRTNAKVSINGNSTRAISDVVQSTVQHKLH